MLAQFKQAKTQFLYLGGMASPHCQDSSPRSDKKYNYRNTTGRPPGDSSVELLDLEVTPV